MRTTLITAVFAALCALVYIACDHGGSTSPEAVHQWRKAAPYTIPISDSACIENAGILHNLGLAYIRANYNHGLIFTSAKNQAAYILSLACGYYQTHGGWDSASNNNSRMQEDLASMLSRRYPASDADLWYAVRSSPALAGSVSTAEIAAIDDAMRVFAMPTAGMNQIQAANRIIARTDSMIAVWNSVRQPSEGEAVGGVLHIMKGSASYWRDHPVSSAESPRRPPELGQLVQVDAIGYLYGWLMAVAGELDATGRLDVANQYRRIGAGLGAAGSWSMGGVVRKYFGL
jgi:hypothetical protein